MRSMQDVVYNWLSIQIVADERQDDRSAVDTAAFFWNLLQSEHEVEDVDVQKLEDMYFVTCHTSTEKREFRFPLELIDCMNDTIKNEPHKFQNYE